MSAHVKKAKRFLTEAQRVALVERYKFAQANGEFLTQKALGREFGVTQTAVGRLLRSARVKTRSRKEANPVTFNVEEAAELYLNDKAMTIEKVAKRLGKSYSVVRNQLFNYGIVFREDADYAKYSKCNRDFFSKITPTTAYFAGFIAADGYVGKNGRFVNFGIHPQDRCILEALKAAANLDQPIVERTEINSGRTYVWLNVCSIDWVKDLHKNFNVVNNKSLSLVPPNITDDSLIWHFIRGYFDGDGHVSETCSRVAITTGSPAFLDWLLEHCGRTPGHIQTHLWQTETRDRYISAKTIFYTGEAKERIIRKMYKDSTAEIRLDRKYWRAVKQPFLSDWEPLDAFYIDDI